MRTILRLTIHVDQCAHELNPNNGHGWKLTDFRSRTGRPSDRDRFDPAEDEELAIMLADGLAHWCHTVGDTWRTGQPRHRHADGIVVWVAPHADCPTYDNRRPSADAFLRSYSQWANGEVYGYTLTDYRTGDDVDSCWGFIGDDEITTGVLDHERQTLTAPNTFVVIDGDGSYAVDESTLRKAGVKLVPQAEADRMIAEDTRAATMEALTV